MNERGAIEGEVLSRPHLVLADVGHDGRRRVSLLVDDVHDALGRERLAVVGVALLLRAQLANVASPFLVRVGVHEWDEVPKHGLDVAENLHAVIERLGELRRVDVHAHDLSARREPRAVTGGTIVEASAEGDEAVALVHGLRAREMAVHALHPEKARGVGGNARDAHERAADGGVDETRELDDLVTGTRCQHAAAEVDEGTSGFVDGRGSGLEVGRVEVRLLWVGQRGRLLVEDLLALDVGGNVHENGALAARVRELEGLANGFLQARDVADESSCAW